MSIQRTGYRVSIMTYKKPIDGADGHVQFEIQFKGKCEDRDDSLLMIADAFADTMKESGLDPIASLKKVIRDQARSNKNATH